MCPHDHSRRGAGPAQVVAESRKRFEHMAIAQIPGRNAPGEHSSVVFLCVLDQDGVLLRVEVLSVRRYPVRRGIHGRLPLQVEQLLKYLALARLAQTETRVIPVVLWVMEVVEA